jgi:hypothetical protein
VPLTARPTRAAQYHVNITCGNRGIAVRDWILRSGFYAPWLAVFMVDIYMYTMIYDIRPITNCMFGTCLRRYVTTLSREGTIRDHLLCHRLQKPLGPGWNYTNHQLPILSSVYGWNETVTASLSVDLLSTPVSTTAALRRLPMLLPRARFPQSFYVARLALYWIACSKSWSLWKRRGKAETSLAVVGSLRQEWWSQLREYFKVHFYLSYIFLIIWSCID